jgi:hypothetical protein
MRIQQQTIRQAPRLRALSLGRTGATRPWQPAADSLLRVRDDRLWRRHEAPALGRFGEDSWICRARCA